jgi:predicted DNA-binding transcriptional regulator YafY
MNRTDRLLAIVLELQSQGWQRAEDLAARFEITRRTAYRDMQALSEAVLPEKRRAEVRDLLPWLLGWGSQVQVLEPATLREQIAREAEALLRHHRPG